jgi:hypothetical protein
MTTIALGAVRILPCYVVLKTSLLTNTWQELCFASYFRPLPVAARGKTTEKLKTHQAASCC